MTGQAVGAPIPLLAPSETADALASLFGCGGLATDKAAFLEGEVPSSLNQEGTCRRCLARPARSPCGGASMLGLRQESALSMERCMHVPMRFFRFYR